MRVYVPLTLDGLRAARDAGGLPARTRTAFAITPALREWYAEGDREELEYAALAAAARGSLHLLAADPAAARRRVVLAADVDERAVTPAPERGRAAVSVTAAVPLRAIAAVHVDGADAQPTVDAAARALAAAAGDPAAAERAVEDTEGFELLWYATQEIPDLLR